MEAIQQADRNQSYLPTLQNNLIITPSFISYCFSNSLLVSKTNKTLILIIYNKQINIQYNYLFNDIIMDSLELDQQFHIQTIHQDGYYHQYCRQYLANVVLTSQVKQLIQDKNHLLSRLQNIEDQEGYTSYDQNHQKSKRFRRTAHQIQRYYKCCVKDCQKSYGSEGSLNQHYKLKHPQIYMTLPNIQSFKLMVEQPEAITDSMMSTRKKQARKYNN